MKNLLITIVLFFAGLFVFIPLFVVGVIYTFIKHIVKLDYSLSKQFLPLVSSITLIFDGLANAGAGELLNDILKIKGRIKYGNWNETISAVTGLIAQYYFKTKLYFILNTILGKNHCENAITEEQKIYWKFNI